MVQNAMSSGNIEFEQTRIRNWLRLVRELSRASPDDEFVLHYQPKVVLASKVIVGAEALIRWQHPTLGLLSPGEFIQLAETTGLILSIGAWVFRQAARFAVQLNRARSMPLTVSVNFSLTQFVDHNMLGFIRDVLEETGADPSWLILELTESRFADESPEIVNIFVQIRAMGLGLSIDDFGTGYSCLSYLERLPISEIKLDKNFIRGLATSRVKQIIVQAVVGIGRELDVCVIAEGIETEAEREALQKLNCIHGQGFLFSKPVATNEFLATIREQD
jgi:EAL domain-containing protein (putative c-di-GMP-specific phosphodiesterase class I)